MSPMEQALRDEIAWHEAEIAFDTRTRQTGYAYRIGEHRARLAALTAALPAPGDAGDWVMVPRAATEAMKEAGDRSLSPWIAPAMHSDTAYAAMLSAAPHPPVSLGEISQAQAQAMREALANLLAAQHAFSDAMTALKNDAEPSAEKLKKITDDFTAAHAAGDAALSASPLPAP